jgi:putative salt-induced outer membrane protein YdiY
MAAQMMFFVRPFLIKDTMKKYLAVLFVAATALLACSPSASAQTYVYTVTNVVTVLVTNIVTVTNVVAAAPAPALKPEVAPALPAPVKSPWDTSLAAGLTLTRGNSDTLLFTAGILSERKGPVNELTLGADGAYGKNDGVENVYTLHGFSQINHLFSDRFYGYLRVNALHDAIADLQYRITLGPGAGYYFVKETNTTFAVEAGSAIVFERLGTNDNTYATLRLAERFEHKFNDRVRVWESVEILPQVDDFNNYLVNAELGIESALSKKLSLQTYVVDNYNNEPAGGRQKNDVKIVSGLKYKF